MSKSRQVACNGSNKSKENKNEKRIESVSTGRDD
jgi:hypothetical protein